VPKISLPASVGVTTDYNKFFAAWEGSIRHIVVTSGSFSRHEVDDIVQELLLSLYEKDYLHRYDPSKNTKLSTFVYNFVIRSILGKRDRVRRLRWREGISLDSLLASEDEETVAWIEALLSSKPDELSPEFINLVVSIYKQLKQIPVTNVSNDFPRLFKGIVQQVIYGISPECVQALGETVAKRTGRFCLNRKALAYELCISESTLASMIKNFRTLAPVRALLPD
jgi:DNA-directed RNA polymerase specialized sigma24 family protein